MKHTWHRHVCILTAIGIAVVVLFAVAVGPAFAHPAKPAAPAAAGATLHVPTIHRVGAPLGTAITVNGTLENFDGTPFADGADVYWSPSDSQPYTGPATTDATGKFTLNNVGVSSGVVLVLYPDGNALLFTNLDFTAINLVLQPGSIGMSVAHQTGYSWVDLWGSQIDLAYTFLATPSGTALAPPGVVDHACVYLDIADAVEWQGTATVVAGAQSATSIDVDAMNSLGVYIRGWASGAAGTKIAYRLSNWPNGYQAVIRGYSEYPYKYQYAHHTYGTWTSPGATVTKTLIVPKTAPPGYPYEIHSIRNPGNIDGLDIYDDFQVCLLRSSSWTIRSGHSIVLSGIVPTSTAARAGAHPGPKKWMIVFARTTAAGQPATWAATGWTKAARVQCNTSGYFRTGALHPKKTTWYVVRYPKDGWNWRAFTQVIKVTVK